MADPDSIIKSIKRTLRWLVIATVAISLVTMGLIVWVWMTAATNHDALCNLRSGIESRVVASEQFIIDNPEGFGGIPVEAIQQGIDRDQQTVDDLAMLSC